MLYNNGIVQIYPATHPTDPNIIRREHLESAYKIAIGQDAWIGGGSIICAGGTIGNNVTIGAGSVVAKNIPDNVIAEINIKFIINLMIIIHYLV